MPRPILSREAIRLEHRQRGFTPACGVQKVRIDRRSQQPHAVITVRCAGRVRQEDLAVLLQCGRAFVDFVPYSLPGEERAADDGCGPLDRPGVEQFGEQQGAVFVGAGGLLLGPDEVARAVDLEVMRVERKGVPVGVNKAFLGPCCGLRISAYALEHKGANAPLVGYAEGDVHVPLSVDVVQFGSPDLVAADAGGLASPDGGFGRGGEALDGGRAADDDAVVGWDGGSEVVVAVGVFGDVRVGALGDQGVCVGDWGTVSDGKGGWRE